MLQHVSTCLVPNTTKERQEESRQGRKEQGREGGKEGRQGKGIEGREEIACHLCVTVTIYEGSAVLGTMQTHPSTVLL